MTRMGAVTSASSGGWTALVERDGERQIIDVALEGAVAGHGRVVLVYGQAGVGRSSLLRAAALDAESRGIALLEARGTELERGYGFGIARQLLEARIAGLTSTQQRSLLAEAGPAAEWALGIGSSELRPAGNGFEQIEALQRMIARLAASSPLLVIVDDLQWCDRPSLDFLCFLGHRVAQLPVTIMAAWRRGEPGVKAGRLQALAGKHSTFFLTPAALGYEGVRAVLRQEIGSEPDDEAVARVHSQTGGLPFLVSELAAGLRLRGVPATVGSSDVIEALTPESVRRNVVARLGRHPEQVQRFARAVAVLGDASLAQAAALADIDSDRAHAAGDALVRAGLLRDDSKLDYAQPLLRRAVYGTLSSLERAALHRRAAELLCDCPDPAERARAAHHLLRSDPAGNPRFGQLLRDAALRELDDGELARAQSCLERALGEVEEPAARGELLVRLAEVELRTGALTAALAHSSEAMSLAAGPGERVAACLVCGQALAATAGWEPAVELLDDETSALNGGEPDTELRLRARAAALRACANAPLAGAIAEVEHLAGTTLPEREMLAAWASHLARTGGSSAERVAELCSRALSEGVNYLACQAAIFADSHELAERVLADEGNEPGTGDDVLLRLAIRSQLALARGDLQQAEADARAALDELGGQPLTALRRRVRSDVLGAMVLVALERTRYGEAEEVLRQLDDTDDPAARCWRIGLALAQSEPAVELAAGLEQAPVGIVGPGVCWRPLAALAHHAAGDGPQAMALADDHLAYARGWGAASLLGRALLVRSVVDPGTERLTFVEDAVAVLEESSATLDLARATIELGAALRRAGRRGEAREQLMRGADLAHRCSADALAARARDELVSVGARPRRAAFSGIGSLTVSELRVARLAAAGLTNRKIAEELTVSAKTVSGQLMAVYRKLDVHDRTALAAAMESATEPEPIA